MGLPGQLIDTLDRSDVRILPERAATVAAMVRDRFPDDADLLLAMLGLGAGTPTEETP